MLTTTFYIFTAESVVTEFLNRVATNLEKPGILRNSLNLENSWNSQGILCNLRGKL